MQEDYLSVIKPVPEVLTAPDYNAEYYAMTLGIWLIVLMVVVFAGVGLWRFASRNAGKARTAAVKVAAASIVAARQATDAVSSETRNAPVSVDRMKREEDAYALAAAEVDTGAVQQGLWAKAFADADGETQRQKALYLRYRAAQLLAAT